jgi:dihydroorotate dehydrogenase electron transfer subunit
MPPSDANTGAAAEKRRRTTARVVRAEAGALAFSVPDWPVHAPGQFVMLTLDPTGLTLDPLLPRPMAIFRREDDVVEVRYRIVGRGTALLATLAPGDPIGVLGPLGRGFPMPDGPATLVGGGTGIASLYELAAANPGARVLLGGRSASDVMALDAFRALPVELGITTEDGSLGHRGRVTERLEPRAGETLYACGPHGMLHAVHGIAQKAGAPCYVSLESPMACAVGICLGCAVATKDGFRYVCTHGPVFDAAVLRWEHLP